MAVDWCIDAWAPTEGLVFASRRTPTEDPWENDVSESVMTFAIAAPNFEAQPVDRSVAFGAVRRGFQERFSIDGVTEFAFKSLDQLITFTRRIYSGSGPGTTGGGGVEPPSDAGPEPEGGGGVPEGFANQFLEMETEEWHSTESDLLGPMIHIPAAQRGQVFRGLITPGVRVAASRLLIECAADAAASGFFKDSSRLVHTAACLNTSMGLNALHSWLTRKERDSRITKFLVRSFEGYHFLGPMYVETCKPHLGEVMQTPIPVNLVQLLGFPRTVRTMLDILSYIAADRLFVVRSSQSSLVPVLLAVAANFTAHGKSFVWYDDTAATQSIDRILNDCSRFIADWLPVEELPIKLEQEVHNWCWRGTRDQRSYKNRNEVGG